MSCKNNIVHAMWMIDNVTSQGEEEGRIFQIHAVVRSLKKKSLK